MNVSTSVRRSAHRDLPGPRRPPIEQPHLADCARCEARRVELVAHPGGARRRRRRTRPTRRFPTSGSRGSTRASCSASSRTAGRAASSPSPRSSDAATLHAARGRRARWVAAAAAAAFVVGVLTGQLDAQLHQRPLDRASPSRRRRDETDPLPLRAVPTTLSEDEFLGQIEMAVAATARPRCGRSTH